jgi:hypothetical protein
MLPPSVSFNMNYFELMPYSLCRDVKRASPVVLRAAARY